MNNFLSRVGVKELYRDSMVFSGENLVIIGQYLGAGKIDFSTGYVKDLKQKVGIYRSNWPVFRGKVRTYLEEQKAFGKRVAIYGAGSRPAHLLIF